MRFAKYHGLGNDFVILDHVKGGPPVNADLARVLCDRHRGVGADGVLTLWPDGEATVRLTVHNADGSESEMCGNGLRCVARYLYDAGAREQSDLRIRLGKQVYLCRRTAGDRIRVDMGRPEANHPDLPKGGGAELTVDKAKFTASCLHFGNPHAVIFTDRDPATLVAEHGEALSHHAAFPHGVNVSFARPDKSGFTVAVYERGVGPTEACGSGACAVAGVAVREQRWPAGKPMTITLPGGALAVEVDAAGSTVMEGEALRVFEGEWPT